MNPVKIGVIGVGHLGNYHSRILAELPTAELVGIFDQDPSRADYIAHQYQTESFAEMSALIETCDALTIAAPTIAHHEIAMQCMQAGKDVLIEKPISHTLEEADELIATAHANNCILQVGHVERFNSVFTTVAPLVHSPKFIDVERLGPYTNRSTDVSVVRDLMIHDIDIILDIVNQDIVDIQAVGFPVLSPLVDIANARLTFKNGCVANIIASRVSVRQVRKWRFFQEDSFIAVDCVTQRARAYSKQHSEITPGEPIDFSKAIERKVMRIKGNKPLDDELAAFVECVKTREVPLVTGEQGRRALQVATEIVDQIKKFSNNGQ